MSVQNILFDAPGPKARLRHLVFTVLGAILVVGIVAAIVWKFNEQGQLEGPLWSSLLTADVWNEYLLPGLWATIKAAGLSIALALVFGLIFGTGRLSHLRPVRWICGVVVEFFRAVPVLLMMYFLFSYFAARGIFTAEYYAFAATVIALTLYNGSVIAELVRSGVFGLPRGQREAGLSVGLTRSQSLRSIELPQALTAMLPALVSQLVVILKDSALGSALPYIELLSQVKNVGTAYGNVIPAYILGAVLFILLNYGLTMVAGLVERRINRRGKTAGRTAGLPLPGAVADDGI